MRSTVFRVDPDEWAILATRIVLLEEARERMREVPRRVVIVKTSRAGQGWRKGQELARLINHQYR